MRVHAQYDLQAIVDEKKKESEPSGEELWEEGDVTGGLKTEALRTTTERDTGDTENWIIFLFIFNTF